VGVNPAAGSATLEEKEGCGMATPIPGAYPSPRIDKGVLRWYEGDTFEIVLKFELQDQDGEAVTMGTTDSVSVEFLDDTRQTVHTFSFASVEDDRVKLKFDATVSAKFTKGKYTYDVRYTHGDKTTLARDNRAFVE